MQTAYIPHKPERRNRNSTATSPLLCHVQNPSAHHCVVRTGGCSTGHVIRGAYHAPGSRLPSDPGHGLEGHFAGHGMLDDWSGIGPVEFDTGIFTHGVRSFPRLMNPRGWKLGKFRDPAADVIAMGIKFLTLSDGMKNTEEGRGIGAASGGPLPTQCIIGEVCIDEFVPEPTSAFPPVDEQILEKKRGNDHPDAIVHPAGGLEFAHAGIDDGIASLALLPGSQPIRIPAPWETSELGSERFCGGVGEMVKELMRELAPADFSEKPALVPGHSRSALPLRRGFERVPNLAGPDLTEMQMRRESRRAIQVRPASVPRIVAERAPGEVAQRQLSARFTGLPCGRE